MDDYKVLVQRRTVPPQINGCLYRPVKLAYDKVEPDAGPDDSLSPIIFLHGLIGDKGHWKDLINEVANATQRTAYAIDARNHGDSEWSEEFTFEIIAEDLLNFMDTLDIPKAILVGHSMGGITAMKVAFKKPERVERLIIEDIGVKKVPFLFMLIIRFTIASSVKAAEATSPEMSEEEAKMFIAKAIFSKIPELVKRREPSMNPEAFMKLISIRQKAEGGWMYKANLAAILKVLKGGKITTEKIEGTYEGPATFIYGTLSQINVGKQENEIRKYFPNADFITIEATHQMHLEKPKEFTEELLKILSGDP